MSSENFAGQGSRAAAEPFLYIPAAGDSGGNGSANMAESSFAWNPQGASGKPSAEEREQKALELGISEGEARARAAFEQQLAGVRNSISDALEKFKSEREEYFQKIEPEVVQLALAIARKILHREAQMDPLLLTGIVRVALEKLDAGTHVRLRAHPGDIHFWNQYFSQPGSFQPSPELIGDPALQPGELALETELGNTRISLDSQLKEIEQGFFDLLEQRPRVR